MMRSFFGVPCDGAPSSVANPMRKIFSICMLGSARNFNFESMKDACLDFSLVFASQSVARRCIGFEFEHAVLNGNLIRLQSGT